jgi:hypothetical protein
MLRRGDELVLLGEDFTKAVEAPLHERAAFCDPFGENIDAAGLDPAGPHPPDFLAADQATFFQDLQVLDHRGQRDIERPGEVADAGRAAAQPLDDGTACGFGKGPKVAVDIGKIKHGLKY